MNHVPAKAILRTILSFICILTGLSAKFFMNHETVFAVLFFAGAVFLAGAVISLARNRKKRVNN